MYLYTTECKTSSARRILIIFHETIPKVLFSVSVYMILYWSGWRVHIYLLCALRLKGEILKWTKFSHIFYPLSVFVNNNKSNVEVNSKSDGFIDNLSATLK